MGNKARDFIKILREIYRGKPPLNANYPPFKERNTKGKSKRGGAFILASVSLFIRGV